MKSLWDNYASLHSSYYRIPVDRDDLFSEDYSYNCKQFITDHFIKGLKKNAIENLIFENNFQEQYANNGKHAHTVDLYLLSLLAQKNIGSHIIQYLTDTMQPGILSWYSFQHLWFLMCFYHDISSCIETGFLDNTNYSIQKQLAYSLKQSKITASPYDNRIFGNPSEKRRKKELAENYFLYRRDCNKIEHGIVSGYLFYDNLLKIYKKESTKPKRKNNQTDNVAWSPEFIDLFAVISDVIIRHNMWTVGEKSKAAAVYREYGLDDLIVFDHDEKKNKICYREQPLHFIFYLLDSIEPLKRFEGNVLPQRVLSNIYITFQADGINLGWTANLEGMRGFGIWRKSIEELPDWLYVSLSDCCNNTRLRMQKINFLGL